MRCTNRGDPPWCGCGAVENLPAEELSMRTLPRMYIHRKNGVRCLLSVAGLLVAATVVGCGGETQQSPSPSNTPEATTAPETSLVVASAAPPKTGRDILTAGQQVFEAFLATTITMYADGEPDAALFAPYAVDELSESWADAVAQDLAANKQTRGEYTVMDAEMLRGNHELEWVAVFCVNNFALEWVDLDTMATKTPAYATVSPWSAALKVEEDRVRIIDFVDVGELDDSICTT